MATTALSASLAQMSALHRNLAVEFENLSAVPAVHNAQSIAQDLRAMKEILQKLTSQMDNVQATLKVHETQNQARDGNTLIRLENARANTPEAPLQPLFSHMSGAPIENFPQTLGEASELNEQQVNTFLCSLGLATSGSLEERIRRFLFACGVSHALL